MRPVTDRKRALDLDQVCAVANSAGYSAVHGKPLHALLTVSWELSAQFTLAGWADLQTRLLDAAMQFLRRRGIEGACAWTRENVSGIGPHSHAAIYIGPNASNLRQPIVEYLSRKFGFEPEGVDISFGRFGANTDKMRAGILRYIVKGFDHSQFRYTGIGFETENIAVALGIRHRGQQGNIVIKRAGTSQNIARAARRAAGWREVRTPEGLHRILNPEPAMQAAA
jgi:hypothetical protein